MHKPNIWWLKKKKKPTRASARIAIIDSVWIYHVVFLMLRLPRVLSCILYFVFLGCRSRLCFDHIPASHPRWHILKGVASSCLVGQTSAGVLPGTCPGRFTFRTLGADWKPAFTLWCLSAADWHIPVSVWALANAVSASLSWLCSWEKVESRSLAFHVQRQGILLIRLVYKRVLRAVLLSIFYSGCSYICCCQEFGSRPLGLLTSAWSAPGRFSSWFTSYSFSG